MEGVTSDARWVGVSEDWGGQFFEHLCRIITRLQDQCAEAEREGFCLAASSYDAWTVPDSFCGSLQRSTNPQRRSLGKQQVLALQPALQRLCRPDPDEVALLEVTMDGPPEREAAWCGISGLA